MQTEKVQIDLLNEAKAVFEARVSFLIGEKIPNLEVINTVEGKEEEGTDKHDHFSIELGYFVSYEDGTHKVLFIKGHLYSDITKTVEETGIDITQIAKDIDTKQESILTVTNFEDITNNLPFYGLHMCVRNVENGIVIDRRQNEHLTAIPTDEENPYINKKVVRLTPLIINTSGEELHIQLFVLAQ